MSSSSSVHDKRKMLILWIGAVLVNIKSIFCDFTLDSAYAMATSYRNLSGDKMLLQMWEPHQTSAFIGTVLMKIFYLLTGGWDFSALFLQIAGVLVFGIATFFLHSFFRQYLPRDLTDYICILFLVLRPKQIPMIEFSNMLLLFSVLGSVFLASYFIKKKRVMLVLAALMDCLCVLSYPSAVVLCLFSAGLVIYFSEEKARDFFIFAGVCALSGAVYLSYLIFRSGTADLMLTVKSIMGSDDSHMRMIQSVYDYWSDTLRGVIILAAGIVLCCLLVRLKVLKTRDSRYAFVSAVFFVLSLAYCFYNEFVKGGYGSSCSFAASFFIIPMIVISALNLSKCSETEKCIYLTGIWTSAGLFLSVLVLTNLPVINVIGYMIPAAMVSLIPLYHIVPAADSEGTMRPAATLFVICFFFVLGRGILIQAYSDSTTMITGIENVVRKGPAKGIFCSYMEYYMTECNIREWDEQIREGENLLVVGYAVDSTEYMYRDSSVSHYSTINTATFNETLLDYWGRFPDKRPDVIAVACWYGELKYDEDSWMMQWIEENYPVRTDGSYFAFFRAG